MDQVLLSTAYLPPINYFSALLKHETIFIEKHEHYIKQTYRNRCEILTANGKLSLSVPLQKNADKEVISGKKISYAENWQVKHWRAITSAYKNSAYFEYFEDDLKPFYHEKPEFILNYNTDLVKLILKLLRQKKEIQFTSLFEQEFKGLDHRFTSSKLETLNIKQETYYQVFADKFGFMPNLSVIDLVFNKGMESVEYLTL